MQSLRSHVVGCKAFTGALRPVKPSFHASRPRLVTSRFAANRSFHTNSSQLKRQEKEKDGCFNDDPSQVAAKQASPHLNAKQKPRKGKTSLRLVALDAERSRGSSIIARGKRRFVDPSAETKTFSGYCVAEEYDIAKVSQLLREEGFELDPDDTGLYPRVIHFETSNSGLGLQGLGDVFIFSSGTVVAWNTSERLVKDLTDRVLLPAAIQPHGLEYEDLEYLEEPSIEVSEIIGDTVLLGTGIDLSSPRSLSHDQIANVPSTNSKRDITL
ncbi:hypothetical protein LTS18_011418, partial [Coniosporium uncinatum]